MKQDQYSKWNAVKVKAKYDYTCATCGSTENIQAHDPGGSHSDWRFGVALCGKCHSGEHPNVPANLFLSSTHQPYWPNISARSLAKEMGCHNRTVIRRALKLGIQSGTALSHKDKERLTKPDLLNSLQCRRCFYLWFPLTPKPKICPNCKSAGYATPKTDRRGLRNGH